VVALVVPSSHRAMGFLAALSGLLIAAAGAVGMVSPQQLIALVARFRSRRGLLVMAAIRIAIGAVLWLAAPGSRAPGFLHGFGALAMARGALTPFFGVEAFRQILDWWSRRRIGVLRIWCGAVLALGLSLVWSVV
jgi:hypothetical protein